jgi:uncharacterized protein (TIGR02271 family)
MHHDEIGRGWTVYDTNDEKIGDVADVRTGYLLVQKGLIFIKDVYIPMSAVSRTDGTNGAVYVSAQKDSIDSMGWDAPPTDAGSSADTARSDTGIAETMNSGDAQRLALHEEELQAQTRRQQAGEVQVNKRVVEDREELEVPVTHDEVQVRRVRVDRDATSGDAFMQDADTVRVPVTAESVEVTKTPRVVEEIEISKRPVTERQTVSDTVRREEADVTKEGDVVIGDGARDLVGSGSDRMQGSSIDDIENATDERADRF